VVVVGLAFSIAGVFALAFCVLGRSQLQVSRAGLQAKTFFSGWKINDSRLDADAIEEITVGKNNRGKLELRASGDHGALTFGKQVSAEELHFVRGCIIATVSSGYR